MSDTSLPVPSQEHREKPPSPPAAAAAPSSKEPPAPSREVAEPKPLVPPLAPPLAASAELSDQDLMERSKGGDMTPYAMLFKRHADRIWRMAYMILHSSAAAEDVTQETFTRGLTHIASYRGEAEPRAWFSSIALNLCRHYLRD